MMAAVAAVFGTMSCSKDNVPSMNQGNGNVPVDGERCIIDESEVIRWLVESLGTISNESLEWGTCCSVSV